MEYRKSTQRKRVERTILLCYSLFALLVLVMAPMFCDDLWVYATVLVTFVLAWAVYIKQYRSYKYRALFVSMMMLICFSLHAMYASSFLITAPTFAGLIILLSIYGIPEIIYLEIAETVFVLLYHALYLKTMNFSSLAEVYRIILPIVAVLVVQGVAYYLICLRIDTEVELWDKIADLEKAEQSKNDFMANVSHEIRTPLNAISGMNEMLLQEELPYRAREAATDIQAAGRKLQFIVSDILDFSELESGKMSFVEEPYNITSTINDVINMCIAQKGDKDVELIVDCDASIPRSLVGDEQKLRRVIMNLMDNAIKFTNHGCIILSISARREEYGVNLSVKVRDTGVGIKEENLEKLFTTFNQVDTRKNRAEGGIGLGLAICDAIVKKMGGFIAIRSKFDEGTEVQFVVPQKVADEAPIVSVNRSDEVYVAVYINMEKYKYAATREAYKYCITHMAKQLGAPVNPCNNLKDLKHQLEKKSFTHIFIGWDEFCEDKEFFEELSLEVQVVLVLERNMAAYVGGRIQCIYKPFYVLSVAAVVNGERILQSGDLAFAQGNRFVAPEANVLVVDDNLMNLRVVEGLLRPYQIKVSTAISGREALKKLETMQYDFVFMDHMMPEMDGVETLHKIRQKPGRYFKEIPVIALTANAIGGVREMFLEEGFQDFMAKPIEISVMERMLRKYLPEKKIWKVEDVEATAKIAAALQEKKVRKPEPEERTERRESDPEFDMMQGVERCGGQEADYLEIARAFYASAQKNIEQIDGYYRGKDWKNYTVLVHALKSSALYIGASILSEQARALEMAGKEGRTADIEARHGEMLSGYRRLLERMLACERLGLEPLEVPKQSRKVFCREIEREELFAIFQELKRLFGDFEAEGVEGLLAKLEDCRYQGVPLAVLVERLRGKVQNFDFMGAEEILQTAMQEFK